MWFLLILVTIVLFLLPLIPAFIEMKWPSDDLPLRVVQEHDGDIRHFAHGFRRYLATAFSQLLGDQPHEGNLPDGTHFKIIGENGPSFHSGGGTIQKLLLSRYSFTLPDEMFCEAEVYSARAITTGANSQFRALLANENITLKEGCTVLRWVHTEKTLTAGRETALYGRASAEHSITLSEYCRFERMYAPRIEFGYAKQTGSEPNPARSDLRVIENLPNVKSRFERRWVVKGDFTLDSRCFFDGDVVALKSVHVNAGSHVKGSIKSNGDMHLGDNVHIDGSVICTGNLYIGKNCRIKGPVIAENIVTIASGTVIGSAEIPTSVVAPGIYIETGSVVYGSVWATQEGAVTSPLMDDEAEVERAYA